MALGSRLFPKWLRNQHVQPLPPRDSAVMVSLSGERVTPLAPESMNFNIDDIAHALAAMPRFAGHTTASYSVAQHSVWCSKHAPEELALYALLRDVPKAYLMEMLGPIKRVMPTYCAAESRLRHHALSFFGLDPHMSAATVLDAVDDAALLVEWRDLKDDSGLAWWGLPCEALAGFREIRPLGFDDARDAFLDRFSELMNRQRYTTHYDRVSDVIDRLHGWRPPTRPEIITANAQIIDLVGDSGHRQNFLIGDIALALGRMPRYAGHTDRPYSVAQHSMMVADLVRPELRLQALIHDASEAYLIDLPSPIKGHFPEYKDIEARADAAIYEAFGVHDWSQNKGEIKQADKVALAVECRDLMRHNAYADITSLADGMPKIQTLDGEQAAKQWTEKVLAEIQAMSPEGPGPARNSKSKFTLWGPDGSKL